MNTPICSTCGCSLVRLGITKEKAVFSTYKEKKVLFCCEGCLEVFKTNPEGLLKETSNLIVCPVCLAEKPIKITVKHEFNGVSFNFCRCPFCLDAFKQDEDYFIKRLEWETNYAGIFGEHDGCCAIKY